MTNTLPTRILASHRDTAITDLVEARSLIAGDWIRTDEGMSGKIDWINKGPRNAVIHFQNGATAILDLTDTVTFI